MDLTHSIIMGIVQGLGEFLPISSSAHLVILPWLFDFSSPGLAFDVGLHVGTLISLLAYFYRDWLILTKSFFTSFRKRPANYDFHERLIWFIILGSIPAAVVGLLIEDYAETVLRNPLITATMMALFGTLLYWVDRKGKKNKSLEEMSLKDAIWVGLAQCLALIPGSSRSGVTITAGMARSMDRITAARFSFLLSTPVVAGAAILKVPDLFGLGLGRQIWIGIAVSAVVGYLAIKYMLYFLRKYSFSVYVIYRWIFAIVVVAVYFLRQA